MIKRGVLAGLAALTLTAAPLGAQDSDRDPGFLAGLIEDNLRAPGLDVQIDGFEGALSSRASVDELRISDDQGTWLVMQDVVLDWNRSALLRGRLEVEELTADTIRLVRPPLPAEGVEPPPAAASGFSLPDLPVSVNIERLAAERIELGEAVLGQSVALTLEAEAQLSGGSGSATLQATRLDGPEGVFAVGVAYEAGETPVLALDLDVREAEGGIAATLLRLPGAPAVELTVAGRGPLDDFTAELALLSDGAPRLAGTVALQGAEDGRAFAVDVSGDVTELFAPRYKPFFGDRVALVARGTQLDAGGLVLDALDLDTEAAKIAGSLRLGPDNFPTFIDLQGTVEAADGTPVLLPTAANVTLRRAELAVAYDPANSDNWRVDLSVLELNHPEVTVGDATLQASGLLSRTDGVVDAATGAIEAAANQLQFTDPALAEAVGARVSLDADLQWRDGEPVRIEDLAFRGPGYALAGDVAIARGETETAGLPATLDLVVTLDDLARFSALAGRDLAGTAEVATRGEVDPLAGTFDLVVEGEAGGLSVAVEQADALLDGTTTLFVDARRSTDGTFLDALRLTNDQLALNASAAIYGEGTVARGEGRTGQAAFEARILDGTLLDPRLGGEITLSADVTQAEDGVWSGTLDGAAPNGIALAASGALTGERPDLQFSASVPDLAAFVEGVPGALSLQGRASAVEGVWTLEADASGPYGIDARIDGPVTGPAPRVAFRATVPDLSGPVPALAGVEPLRGPVELEGVASQANGVWSLDTTLETAGGVAASLEGPVTGEAPRVAFEARVPDLQAFSPALAEIEPLAGAATLRGTAANRGEAWVLDVDVETDGGITAAIDGPVTGPAPRVAFSANVPELEAFSPALEGIAPLEGAAALEGVAEQQDGVWSVDAALATDGGVEATVRGPVTGDSPRIAFDAAVPDLSALAPALDAPPFRTPATLSGTAARAGETWTVDAAVDTETGLAATASGPVTGPAPRVAFSATVPDATALSPALADVGPLRGETTVEGVAAQSGGVWSVDVDVASAGGLAASVDGAVTGDAPSVAFALSVPDGRALAPALAEADPLAGRAAVEGTAARAGETWTVDVDLTTEGGTRASVEGPVTGPAPRVVFDVRVPELQSLAPALEGIEPLQGAATLQGVAEQTDGAWRVDADLATDGGIAASADGTVTGDAPSVAFSARVPELEAFSPALEEVAPLRGAAVLEGTASQREGVWSLDAALETDGGVAAEVSGPVTGEAPDVAFRATVPDLSAFSPALAEIEPLQTPATLAGNAARTGEIWTVDADVTTRTGIAAAVSGPVTGPAPRVAFSATVPELEAFSAALEEVPPLRGAAALEGVASQDAGIWSVDAAVTTGGGVEATVTGPVTGDAPRLAFEATVPDVAAFSPALAEVEPLNTDATLTGTAAREGDVWSVDAALRTGSGIEATVRGPVTGEGAPRLAFDASVPDLSAFSPALDGIAPLESAATLSGTAAQVDGAFVVDVEAATESGIEAAVEGTVTGPAPSVAFSASVPDASALSPALTEVGPLQGAATLAGTASQVDGAWTVDVGFNAEGGLAAEVEGTVTGDSPRIAFEVSAPDLRALSPALAEAEPLEGPGTLSGTVARPDGAWDVDVALRTEGGTTADVEGTVTGDSPRIEASVTVPALNRVNPALNDVPALQGTATLDAVVEKDGDVWSVDAALDTEGGIEVRADGTVTGDAPRLTFSARVPELEGFSPAIAEVGPLSGEAVLDGVVERDGDTWEADVTLTTEGGIEATVEGPVTGDAPRLAFAVTVPRLGELSPAFETIPPLQGTATLEGLLTRPDDAYVVDARLRTEGGIEADVEGTVTGASPDVAFTVRVPEIESFSEALEAIPPLTGAAVLEGTARRPGEAWIVDAALDVDGGFRATAEGPVTGPAPRVAFTAAVPDLQDVNPALAAYPALAGRAALEGTLAQTDGAWRLDVALDAPAGITARARGPVTGPDAVSLAFQATVPQIEVFAPDLPPALRGTLSLDGALDQTPEGFALDVAAAGPLGARATAATVLGATPLAVDFTLALPSLEPLAPVPGGVDVAGSLRQTEDGFAVTAQGTGPYDVELTADADLGAEGITVSARGRLPEAGVLVPQLSGPVAFDVTAVQRNAIWSVDADLSGAGGLSLSVEGPVTGPNPSVAFRLGAADVSPFAPGLSGPLDASGRLFGRNGGYAFEVDASGPLGAQLTASGQATGPGAPQASFDLRVPDVSPLVPDLAGPLRATGTASQGPDGIAVDVDLTGPGGTTASVAGTVGSTLALGVTGQIPLGLANPFIAPNNLDGTARVDLRVDGPPALESVRGTISTSGASLLLPTLRNGLDGIDATVTLAGDRATVDLRGTPSSGGVLTLSGPVELAPPFDGALALRFDGRLEDPNLYTARVIATVDVAGPLAGGATISGDILLDEAEISVPSTGLTAVGELPDVRHVNVTRPVMRTLERAGLDPAGGDAAAEGDGADGDGGGGPVYGLNLRVRAPNRIFVRGRGLDAELGGDLQITGTTAAPVVSGGFELVRGRLDILEQRFQLDEGRISFSGSLVPFIRLVAITESDALTASIIVEGPANAPEVRFESTPDVPQEEILAQIFFGRDLSQLSALQALQLANSVATLAGRGSGGLLERLRGNAGLDDLDLTTDADGNTAIRAGKYISDNVYTDVQVDQDGDATVTLNLDITPNLTVRGSAGAAGDTSIGLFFEKDY